MLHGKESAMSVQGKLVTIDKHMVELNTPVDA